MKWKYNMLTRNKLKLFFMQGFAPVLTNIGDLFVGIKNQALATWSAVTAAVKDPLNAIETYNTTFDETLAALEDGESKADVFAESIASTETNIINLEREMDTLNSTVIDTESEVSGTTIALEDLGKEVVEENVELEEIHFPLIMGDMTADVMGGIVVTGQKFGPSPVTYLRSGECITESGILSEESVHIIDKQDRISLTDFPEPGFKPFCQNFAEGPDHTFVVGIVPEVQIVSAPDEVHKADIESTSALAAVQRLKGNLQFVKSGDQEWIDIELKRLSIQAPRYLVGKGAHRRLQ
jgi:hypothetical protein